MAEVPMTVHEDDADADEVDNLVCVLRAELLGLEVDGVTRAQSAKDAPPGSRGADVAAIGVTNASEQRQDRLIDVVRAAAGT